MAQPSIANYFATRKRSAIDEANIFRAKKVLILDGTDDIKGSKGVHQQNESATCDVIYSNIKETSLNINDTINDKIKCVSDKELKFPQRNRVVAKLNFDSVKTSSPTMTIKKAATPKGRPRKANKDIPNQQNIQSLFMNMQNNNSSDGAGQEKVLQSKTNSQKVNEKTPPVTPVKNAMDKVSNNNKELSLNEIKTKLTRSSRLAELKASIAKFNKSADKLKEVEKKTAAPALKSFKSIELEVQLSPKKTHVPAKSYLSPKKDLLSPRKNLFGLSSPSKPVTSPRASPTKVPAYQRYQSLASPGKPSLTLPFKYRSLAEMFRSIDTVCAMLFNRKETITFNKIKPAVQEMMRRNLTMQHFAQIQSLYPAAFTFSWEKMKTFASASRQENYEMIVIPVLNSETEPVMNPTCLLERRRKLYAALVEKVKDYHSEFLSSLEPPMLITHDKITRWHPEFDIEKVPDIQEFELPKKPEEEKLTTGQEVLERARSLFNCNTRMEKALERLKQKQEQSLTEEVKPAVPTTTITSTLKGIPKALLEKIRAKQAAKALDAMTRSASQDKESLMYSRLPEIARLMRNTYVTEKKGVLPLEELIIKLNNSYRSFLTNYEIEEHLRLLSKVVPGWIMFHEIRRTLFVKLSRDGDMNKVMTKLDELVKEKCGT